MTSRPSISTDHRPAAARGAAGRAGRSRSSPASSPPPSRSASPSCSPGLNRAWRSPVLDVGDRLIDAAPPFVKEFAIDTFGTNDKPALLDRHRRVPGRLRRRRRRPRPAPPPRGRRSSASACSASSASGRRPAGGRRTVARRAAQRARRGGRASAPCCWCNGRSRRPAGGARPADVRPTGAVPAPLRDRARARSPSAPPLLGSRRPGARAPLQRRPSRAPRSACRPPPSRWPPLPPSVQLDVAGDHAVRHAQRRLLPDRHRAHGAPGAAPSDYTLRIHGMVDNELELSYDDLLRRPMIERDITLTCVSNEVGGALRRQRPLARHPPRRPAAGGRRAARRRPGRRSLGRRLRVRLPRRQRDGRPRRARRRRHERRAAADRARLPGPPRRPRALRVRLGHEVADRDRADDVRRVRPLLAATGLGPAGADQADEPHRHARVASARSAAGTVPIAGVAWAQHDRHRRRRGADRRRRRGSRPSSATSRRRTRGASGCFRGKRPRAATPSPCGPPTRTAQSRRATAPNQSPTAPPDSTRSWSSSADSPHRLVNTPRKDPLMRTRASPWPYTALAAFAALTLVAAACGDDDDSSTPATTGPGGRRVADHRRRWSRWARRR